MPAPARRLIQDLDLDLGEIDDSLVRRQPGPGRGGRGENQDESGESASAGAQTLVGRRAGRQRRGRRRGGRRRRGRRRDDAGRQRRRSRPARPAGQLPRGRADENAIYRAFSIAADEVIDADKLCDSDELGRLRHLLDQQLSHLQSVIARLANRLQRRLLAKQTRAWEFDLEEGILDAARLSRVVTNPVLPLSYKQEQEMEFRDTVVTPADRQFRLDARPADHGGGDERRHPGAHPGTLRRQGRDPRLHDPGVEGRPGARELDRRRQAGQPRPAQRSAAHRLQAGRRAVAARPAQPRA